MFRDRQRELERLKEELLAEDEEEALEEAEEALEEAEEAFEEYPTPAMDDTQLYDTISTLPEPDALFDRTQQPRRKQTALVAAALLITAGVLVLLAWMMLRMRGLL